MVRTILSISAIFALVCAASAGWGAACCLFETKGECPKMAVKIRLARHGAKKRPYYRIVVADSESPRDGRFLESVGAYNPLLDPAEVTLKTDRVQYWLQQGAMPTDTVKSLLKKQGLFAQPAQ